MEQLLLVNPRRRSRVRRRNPRKRRMPAALRAYWAKHRRGKHRVRLANPRRRRRRNPVMASPRRRRRRHHVRNPRRYHARRHYRNRRRHYRRLRNPRSGGGVRVSFRNVLHEGVIPAGVGAGGALALDVLMGYANPYLPASLQVTSGSFNALNLLAKLAGAVGIGMLASKFMGSSRGRTVLIGAMTVTLYSSIRTLTTGSGIPGLSGLQGLSDYTPFPTSGRVGAYLSRPTGRVGGQTILRGLSYTTPATVVGPSLSPRMGAYMPRGAAVNVMPEETGI